jgi:hypothetical protein
MTRSGFIRRFLTTAATAAAFACAADVSVAMPAFFSARAITTPAANQLTNVGYYFDWSLPGPFIGDVVSDPSLPVLDPDYYVPYNPLPFVYLAPALFCPPQIFYGSGRLAERIYGPYPPTRYSSIYAGFGRTWASFPHRPFRGYKGYYR